MGLTTLRVGDMAESVKNHPQSVKLVRVRNTKKRRKYPTCATKPHIQ